MPLRFGRQCHRNCQFWASFVPEGCTHSNSDAQSDPIAAEGYIVDAVEGFLQGRRKTVGSTQVTFWFWKKIEETSKFCSVPRNWTSCKTETGDLKNSVSPCSEAHFKRSLLAKFQPDCMDRLGAFGAGSCTVWCNFLLRGPATYGLALQIWHRSNKRKNSPSCLIMRTLILQSLGRLLLEVSKIKLENKCCRTDGQPCTGFTVLWAS